MEYKVYEFKDYLFLSVADLPQKKLVDPALARETLMDLVKLLETKERAFPATYLYVHQHPNVSFTLGHMLSGSLQVLLCIVPPNQKLDLYVFCAGKENLGKYRDKVRKIIHKRYAPKGARAYVREREA